jgi:hypothetical protein
MLQSGVENKNRTVKVKVQQVRPAVHNILLKLDEL